MQEYAEIHEQRRLGYQGAGELLTAWSRVGGCEEGARALAWGRSLWPTGTRSQREQSPSLTASICLRV